MEAIKISEFTRIKESEIIKRILEGEKDLFEILLRRNNQKLYRVIRSYLSDRAEIKDVMQDAYLKAYEKLSQFRQTSTFSTWLIRIGINEALARLKYRTKVMSLGGDSNTNGNSKWQFPDASVSNPEKKIIENEMKHLLENAIDKLEQKYKCVYVLKEVEGMSTTEVAECLDLSIENVKVRLHRARNMLKENLVAYTRDAEIFTFGSTECDDLTNRVMKLIQ